MAATVSTDPPSSREPPPEIIVDSAAHRLVPALALSALIVLAPLPFGAAHGWSLWLLQAVSLTAAALLLGFEGIDSARSQLRPLLAPALLLLAVVLVQLLPLPLAWLRLPSPAEAALYERLVDSPGRWFAASVNPHASLVSLLRLAACGAAFVVVAIAPLPGRRSLFYWAILLSGTLAAVSSWWHVFEGWDTRLFGEFSAYQAVAATPRLHWPLLNPNHLAAAMNTTWLVAGGAFLSPSLLGARMATRESHVHRTIALLVALLAVSVTIGTRSKGGLASGVAGLALLALLWPTGRGSTRSLVLAVRAAAALGVLVGVGWMLQKAWAGVDHTSVLAALQRRDATLQVRLEVIHQGGRILREFFFLGTGLGTWGDVFPRFQAYPLLFATVTHAHCDPLEWLTDLGVVGFAAVCLFGAAFVREAWSARDDEARRRRAILGAALGSLLFHALGDFALRVPSIALCAAALLGLLWRETPRRPVDRAAPREAEPSGAPGVVDALTIAVCWAFLVYLSSWEWRDERLLARLTAKEAVTVPETSDWRVFEALSRRRAATGQSGLQAALRAVWSSPLSARSHHALAYGYVSDEMRERELRRTVACEPSVRFWRMEHALSLAALGRFALARREIEEGFYFDPQFGDVGWLRFEDPIDRTFPFLEAALRGVRRRTAQSPEVAGDLLRFEQLEEVLRGERERRQHVR